MDEQIRELPELGLAVSNTGRVYCGGVQMNQCKTGIGYRAVCLKGKSYPVHRLVLLAFVGPCPEGYEVHHKDGDRANNSLDNLEYVTSSENTLHAVKAGTWPLGERRWNAVLNDGIVREMRQMYADGMSIRQIASRFNTNFATTYHVVKRNSWKHVA